MNILIYSIFNNKIFDDCITYDHRNNINGEELLLIKSKNKLNIRVGDIINKALFRMNKHKVFHCLVEKARVIEILEDSSGFKYTFSGNTKPLTAYEYGEKKKEIIKSNNGEY